MTLTDLRGYWAIANVQAMARVVREKESSQRDDAYTITNGGAHFSPPLRYEEWQHPWHGIPTTKGAKACGAYQHLGTTWASLCQRYGIRDFSPPSQDAGFVGGLIDRKALDDVIAGRFDEAVSKLIREWTSLPGAAESRGDWTMDKARALFLHYGGALTARDTIPADAVAQPKPRSPDMGASLVAAFLPTILEMFAGRANAAVQKISGAPPEASRQFIQTMSEKVEQLAGIPVTDNASALKAVADVVDDPAKMQALEDHALDYMEKIKPVLEILATHELAVKKQADDSADRAAARGQKDKYDISRLLAVSGIVIFLSMLAFVGAAMLLDRLHTPDKPMDALLASMLTILVYAGARIAEAAYRYRFGGTAESTVINAGDSAVRAAIPPPKGA